MKLTITVPYYAPEALRQRFEGFLRALCEQARACQQANPYRPQYLELGEAQAVAWVDRRLLPCDLAAKDGHYFCIYGEPPGPEDPCGEWVLWGRVQRVVLCRCGQGKGGQCAHEGQGESEGEADACERCRCRVGLNVNELFPLTDAEVMRTLRQWFEAGPMEARAGVQGGVMVSLVGEGQEAVRRRYPPRTLGSTRALLGWMAAAEDPRRFQVHREAWERLRKTEPGWEELTDVEHAFKCVARRCLDQIMGRSKRVEAS